MTFRWHSLIQLLLKWQQRSLRLSKHCDKMGVESKIEVAFLAYWKVVFPTLLWKEGKKPQYWSFYSLSELWVYSMGSSNSFPLSTLTLKGAMQQENYIAYPPKLIFDVCSNNSLFVPADSSEVQEYEMRFSPLSRIAGMPVVIVLTIRAPRYHREVFLVAYSALASV